MLSKSSKKSPSSVRRRVLFDLRPLQTSYKDRGIGLYTREVARRLAPALEGSAPSLEVCSLVFAGLPVPLPQIPVLLAVAPRRRQWLYDQAVLPFFLRRYGVHLFHSFVGLGPLDRISFPALAARKSVITVHDLHLFGESASPLERFYRETWRIRLQEWGLPFAARILTDSEAVAEEIRTRYGGSGPLSGSGSFSAGGPSGMGGAFARRFLRRDAVRTALLGCNHLDAVAAERPAGFAADKPAPFLLAVGDMETKNLPFSLAVAERLIARPAAGGKGIRLVIVGQEDRVRERLRGREIPASAQVTGALREGEVKWLYQNALALLHPAVSEGFGLPPFEALRLGLPVLAADIEPLRSLLPGGVFSLAAIEPWVRALEEVLEGRAPDGGPLREYRARAAATTERFTWEACVRSILEAYPLGAAGRARPGLC